MIKGHKLTNGDIIKFLPTISDNGEFVWIHRVDTVIYTNHRPQKVFDKEGKWIKKLLEIEHKTPIEKRRLNHRPPVSYTLGHYCNVLINGEVKVISFGRTIYNIITSNPDLFKLESDLHLVINIEERQGIPIFDKSFTINLNWNPPVSDVDSISDWIFFIKKNQSNLDDYFESNNFSRHKEGLIKFYGTDIIGEIINEEREEKINTILK